jgi:hypothetical protein
MKRIVTLAIIAALILGVAAFTYADVKFGASGFVRVRSAWYMNARNGIPAPDVDIPGFAFNGSWNDTQAWMDTRFRIKFTSSLDDVASGVIYLEGDSSFWGEAPDGRNTAGAWNADRNAVEIKQFYIDFKVPGLSDVVPTTVQAGVIGYYYRPHICTSSDGAGVRVDMRPGPVWIQLNWMKPWEADIARADDTDVYAARVVYQGLPVHLGVWGQYWKSNSWSAGTPIAWPAAVGQFNNAGTGQNGGTDKAGLFWLGFQAIGKIGPVALTGDFIYNGGKIEREYGLNPAAAIVPYVNPIDDESFGGWIAYIDAAFTIPNFPLEIGATFSYSTGDDAVDAATDREHSGFYMTPGSEAAYTGHSVVFFASSYNDAVGITRGDSKSVFQLGAAGVWFGKLRASMKPLPWLKMTLFGMYIGDNTDSGDLYGTAVATNAPTPWGGVQTLEDSSDIGIEVGLETDIQIYKSLVYSIGLGYLFAGDALDQYTGVDYTAGGAFVAAGTVPGAIPINDSPKNPWAVVSQLIYKF